MTEFELKALFENHNTNCLEWVGTCHDCKKECSVTAIKIDGDFSSDITIDGGAVYAVEKDFYIKCDDCFNADPVLRNFQACDIYSRVVGYYSAKRNMNLGKQAEFEKRKNYVLEQEMVI